jgi:hypothetical protein
MLRKIKFRDPPFDNNMIDLGLERYLYENEDAIAVSANGTQIGHIPKQQVGYLIENWDRIDRPTHIDVYGGGEGGYFGCEIIIRLFMR